MTNGLYIPKVLRRCRFVGFEKGRHHTHLVFVSDDPLIEGGIVRVVVSFKGGATFLYSVYDPASETIVHYEGTNGDPDLDEATEVKGTTD